MRNKGKIFEKEKQSLGINAGGTSTLILVTALIKYVFRMS